MDLKIKDLEIEIEVLKERISKLERIEKRRKIGNAIKFIIIFGLLLFFGIIFYHYYQELLELYNSFLINF